MAVDYKNGVTINSDTDMDGVTGSIDSYDGQTIVAAGGLSCTFGSGDSTSPWPYGCNIGAGDDALNLNAGSLFVGTKLVTDAGVTPRVTGYKGNLRRTGDVTGITLNMALYTSHVVGSDDNPYELITGTSVDVLATDVLITLNQWYVVDFSLSTPKDGLSAATKYWYVVTAKPSGSSYVQVCYDQYGSCGSSYGGYAGSIAGEWTIRTYLHGLRIYGCQ